MVEDLVKLFLSIDKLSSILSVLSLIIRPIESQLRPWCYKQHEPLCRSHSTGARGGYNKCKSIQNCYKTLVFHNATKY